jgi:nucleoside-diphosphate-sugar epimerase
MNQHRIVLTGASGMLGGAILKQLASRHDVIALALYRSVWPRGTAINVEPRLLDLARRDDVDRMLQEFRPTAFIHTAAVGMQHPLPDMATLAKVNVELPLTLMAAVSQILNCHFVQISSGLAYKDQGRLLREDDPLKTSHPYGASKAEAEQHLQALAQDRGVRLTILRPFSFTGERDFGTRLFPSLLRSAVEQRPFEMSPGDQVREHSSVNDIGRGLLLLRCNRSTPPSLCEFSTLAVATRDLCVKSFSLSLISLGCRSICGSAPDRVHRTSRCLPWPT